MSRVQKKYIHRHKIFHSVFLVHLTELSSQRGTVNMTTKKVILIFSKLKNAILQVFYEYFFSLYILVAVKKSVRASWIFADQVIFNMYSLVVFTLINDGDIFSWNMVLTTATQLFSFINAMCDSLGIVNEFLGKYCNIQSSRRQF